MKHCKDKKLRVSIFQFFEPILAFVISTILIVLWVYLSSFEYNILKKETMKVIIIYGLIFSYLCNQLVISRIFRMRVPWYNSIQIIPLAGVVSSLLRIEEYSLHILLLVLFVQYTNFVVSVTNQIANHLNIKIFLINPPQKKKEKKG